MVNVTLLWYLIVPIILSAVSIFLVRKWVPDLTWAQAVGIGVIGLIISGGITSASFYIGKGSKTRDTEILNGEVVSKDRKHGSYVRRYECNCTTYYTGSGKNRTSHRRCQTCTEDHYTVNWTCYTNVGNFTIESYDRTSRSVYNSPDPARYTIIEPGDPVSRTHGYTNYIKAVPETLFRPISGDLKERFKGRIPAYPDKIYDFYHVDRVITDGVTIPDIKRWNGLLSEVLKKLGPKKQANAVIVITKSASTDYFFALQDAWSNGKKNDVVLVIGAPEFPKKAAWVRIMALTTDQTFQVKLRDSILGLDNLTADSVVRTLANEIQSSFKRKSMMDFKYLDAEISPPSWVMNTNTVFIILAYAGFWFFAYYHRDGGSYGRFGTPHLRRRSYPY